MVTDLCFTVFVFVKPIWILAQFTNCSTFRPSFTSRIICYTIFRTGAFLRTVTSFTNAVLLLRFAWKHHLPTPLHRSAAATVPEPSAAAAVLALLCWACCHRIPSRRLLRRGLYLVAAAQQASERKCQTRFYSFFLSGMPNPEPKPPCCW